MIIQPATSQPFDILNAPYVDPLSGFGNEQAQPIADAGTAVATTARETAAAAADTFRKVRDGLPNLDLVVKVLGVLAVAYIVGMIAPFIPGRR